MRIAQRIAESGFSIEEIAKRAGIARIRVQEILAGSDATVVELRDLAGALGLSVSDFLPRGDLQSEVSRPFQRSMARRRGRKGSGALIESFSTLVSHAFELLPERNSAPDWTEALKGPAEGYEDAERLATRFRQLFFERNDLAPMPTLPEIAVGRLEILLYLVDSGEFEGASAFIREYPFAFVARRQFRPKMLFTLAHEIGHLIADHGEQEFATVDRPSDVEQIKASKDPEEAFADAFASCLLLPRAGVQEALHDFSERPSVSEDAAAEIETLYLARLFDVSFRAAAKRCEDLGLLPAGGAAALYDRIRRRHRSPEQYADELGLPARAEVEFPALPPLLLRDAVDAIRSGRISVGRASSILNLSIADILRIHTDAWPTS